MLPNGVYTVLVTPFVDSDRHSGIDFDSIVKWLDQQCSTDVSGLVLLGTTSEAPTLSTQEKVDIVKFVHEYTQKLEPE